MSSDQGYQQSISTADFTETPRLVLEQPTGDVIIEAWDQTEIQVSTPDDNDEFELEVSGSQVLIRPVRNNRSPEEWAKFAPDLANLGIDLEKMISRGQRSINRTMRHTGKGIDIQLDIGRWTSSRDYHIKVPFNCHLSLRTSSGDLTITGPNGTHLIQTTSGDIRMRRMSGNLLVSSASGDVWIDGLEGRLGVKSASGEIEILQANVDELSAHTASGDVNLDLVRVPEREFDVRSVSGDVSIRLPRDARVTVEMSTVSGDVDCSLTHSKQRNGRIRTLLVNGGGTAARIGTVSGDVAIDARRGGSSGDQSQQSGEGSAQPEGPTARQQAEMEILQMVERGELSPQDAMRRLSDLPR